MSRAHNTQELKELLANFYANLSVDASNLMNLMACHQELYKGLGQLLDSNQVQDRKQVETLLEQNEFFQNSLQDSEALSLALQELSMGLTNLGKHLLHQTPPQ